MGIRINYNKGDKVGTCIFLEETIPDSYYKLKSNKIEYIRKALFKCTCGKEFETQIISMRRGNTKSCGCLNIKRIQQEGGLNKKHGQRYHPLYNIWIAIFQRCYHKNCIEYPNYGQRGIIVCERWHNIDNFIEDMYSSYKKDLQIDRINNNGNYEPSNCKWSTGKQNSNNKRNNRIIEYKGITKTISEWADYMGIPYRVFFYRITCWDIEKAMTTYK